MSTRVQRKAVFEDTESWVQSNAVLQNAVQDSIEHSIIYKENEYPDFKRTILDTIHLEVTKERSFEAAFRLHQKQPLLTTAVLNFANAFHPGGGVTYGSGAQEECLCRTSTLYDVITSKAVRPFYQDHIAHTDAWADDSLIYSPDILVCKSDQDLPERLPEDKWIKADVITMAAPDLRTLRAEYGGMQSKDAEVFGIHVKRAIHMLYCAAAQGADNLILGAFGCGAFGNNPSIVAKAWKTAVSIFPNVFEHIVFAIYCPPQDETNYQAFQNELL